MVELLQSIAWRVLCMDVLSLGFEQNETVIIDSLNNRKILGAREGLHHLLPKFGTHICAVITFSPVLLC